MLHFVYEFVRPRLTIRIKLSGADARVVVCMQ